MSQDIQRNNVILYLLNLITDSDEENDVLLDNVSRTVKYTGNTQRYNNVKQNKKQHFQSTKQRVLTANRHSNLHYLLSLISDLEHNRRDKSKMFVNAFNYLRNPKKISSEYNRSILYAHNIINVMKMSRNNYITGEYFENINFGNVSLLGIYFSKNGQDSSCFNRCAFGDYNFLNGQNTKAFCLSLSNGSDVLVAGYENGNIILYDLKNCIIKSILHPSNASSVTSCCLCPNNTGFLVGYSDGTIDKYTFSGMPSISYSIRQVSHCSSTTIRFDNKSNSVTCLYCNDGIEIERKFYSPTLQHSFEYSDECIFLYHNGKGPKIISHQEKVVFGLWLNDTTAISCDTGKHAIFWDIDAKQIMALDLSSPLIHAAVPHGKNLNDELLILLENRIVELWSNASEEPLWTWKMNDKTIAYTDFSEDGKYVYLGNGFDTYILEHSSGKIVDKKSGFADFVKLYKYTKKDVKSELFSIAGSDQLSTYIQIISRNFQNAKPEEYYRLTQTTSDICISDNGRFVITVYFDFTIVIWELKTEKKYTFTDYNSPVSCVAISDDDSEVIVGTASGKVNAYELQTQILLWSKDLHSQIKNIRYLRSGKTTIISDVDGTVYKLNRKGEIISLLSNYSLNCIDVSQDENWLASGFANEPGCCVIDMNSQKIIYDFRSLSYYAVSISISDTGHLLALFSDNAIMHYSIADKKILKILHYDSNHSNISISSQYKYFALFNNETKELVIRSLKSYEIIKTINNIDCYVFHNQSKKISFCNSSGFYIYDISTNTIVCCSNEIHNVFRIIHSKNDACIAFFTNDGKIKFYDNIIKSLGATEHLYRNQPVCGDFMQEEKYFAYSDVCNYITLIDIKSCELIFVTISYADNIVELKFSKNEKECMIIDDNGGIEIWNSKPGRKFRSKRNKVFLSDSSLTSFAVSNSQSHFAKGLNDGRIYIFNSQGEEVDTLCYLPELHIGDCNIINPICSKEVKRIFRHYSRTQ